MAQLSQETHPQLGLVCITTSDDIRYRTITRKRLLTLSPEEQYGRLHDLYAANLAQLAAALDYCVAHGISLYRITSNLLPFADSEIGAPVMQEFASTLAMIGNRATELDIRLVMHPDQFVVLNSDSPQVVQNSINILAHHAQVMDLLEQPRSPWAMLEIHGGKGNRAEALIQIIRDLPPAIRSRLALENDEHIYSASEILAICQTTGVPMVFDAHHHVCKEGLDSYEDPTIPAMVEAARATWPDPDWQVVHISNGREAFCDRRHHDYVETMPAAYASVPWIEVEAKHKEKAISRLREEWPVLSH